MHASLDLREQRDGRVLLYYKKEHMIMVVEGIRFWEGCHGIFVVSFH